jgi:polysaccharide export outer membrane protein
MKPKDCFVYLIVFIFIGTFLSACATAPSRVSQEVPEGDYLLGPEDVLEVSVWKEEDLSKEVMIRPDGKISLPLIGDIQAAELTVEGLKENITQALAEFIDEPSVLVTVKEINSLKIFVQGEVAQPGAYGLKSNHTVIQAISLAGGFTEWAKKDKMVIFRKEGDRVTSIPVNYDRIISGKAPGENIILKRGDTITVP